MEKYYLPDWCAKGSTVAKPNQASIIRINHQHMGFSSISVESSPCFLASSFVKSPHVIRTTEAIAGHFGHKWGEARPA
jgi:hypothetical protein